MIRIETGIEVGHANGTCGGGIAHSIAGRLELRMVGVEVPAVLRRSDGPERVETAVAARPARTFEAASVRFRKGKGLNEVGLGVMRRSDGF